MEEKSKMQHSRQTIKTSNAKSTLKRRDWYLLHSTNPQEDLIDFHKNEKEALLEEKQKLDFEHNILKRKMDDIEEHYRSTSHLNSRQAARSQEQRA